MRASETNPTVDTTAPADGPSNGVLPTRIIKVRNRDGTIVKVKRPVKSASTTTIPSAYVGMPNALQPQLGEAHDNNEITQTDHAFSRHRMEDKIHSEKSGHEFTAKAADLGVVVHETEKKERNKDGKPEGRRSGPQALQRSSRAIRIIIWTIMIACPLLFITLGILAASVTGQSSASVMGNGIAEANKVAVSTWPIVFAAILAQTLRMYASYKAERGISLMTLEQLISSHSVAGAIKQPFLLWRLDWTSLVLICLWSLSPLAGQAFLRVSYIGINGSTSDGPLAYLNISGQSVAFGEFSFGDAFVPNVDILFGSSIAAPSIAQQNTQDAWNNTKIPILDKSTNPNDDGWYNVEGSSPAYSSLLGVPVFNLPQDTSAKSTDFSIQSSYYEIDCPALKQSSPEEVTTTFTRENMTLHNSSSLLMGIKPPDGLPGKLLFASYTFDDKTYAYTNCTLSQSFVESNISCFDGASFCSVTAMRDDPSPASYTPGADDFVNMVDYFLQSGISEDAEYSPKEYFLSDITSVNRATNSSLNLYAVPTERFTARLALLFNTYWQAGVDPFAFTGKEDTINNADPHLNTNATFTDTSEVYYTGWGWLAVLLVSSTILLIAGVAGAILDSRTVGPDIFGFASSLAHKNRYMRVPDGGSTMSGAARARLLDGIHVMLQDVRPDQEVGKIALGTVDQGGQRLKGGRLYI